LTQGRARLTFSARRKKQLSGNDMAWREITVGGTHWNVSPVAEKTQRSSAWRLVLAFRPNTPRHKSIWAQTTLEAPSPSDLFAKADRMTAEKLTDALNERLG